MSFDAKSSADVRRDHAYARLWKCHRGRDEATDDVHHLRRGPDGHRLRARIELAEHPSPLHGRGRIPMMVVPARKTMLRPRQSGLNVTRRSKDFAIEIIRGLLMHHRRAR